MKKILQFFAKATLALMAFVGLANNTNAQCIAGEVEVFIDVTTDTWGYESYWELVPTGQPCGGTAIFVGGNAGVVGCLGGGAQTAANGDPGAYPNTATTTEPLMPPAANGFCLTIGNSYDIVTVDDWGDGGTSFSSVPQNFNFVQSAVSNETFTFTALTPVTDDLETLSNTGEYTIVPLNQVVAMNLDADIRNNGSVAVTDAVLTVNVYLAPNLVTPVQTTSSPATAVASSGIVTLSGGTYLPSGSGDYIIDYIVSSATITDANAGNDMLTHNMTVSTNGEYARDFGAATINLGLNAPSSGILGNVFDVNVSAQMDSVYFNATVTAGDSGYIYIYDVVAGVPTTQIGESANYLYTGLDASSTNITYPVTDMSGGVLTLTPGKYFVGVWDSYTGFVGLGFAPSIYTVGGTQANIDGGPWSDIGALGFPQAAIIRPYMSVATVNINEISLENVSIYPNPSTGVFTINNNNGTIDYTIRTIEGKVVRKISNVSSSTISIDLSNENNGVYFLTVNEENTNKVFKIVKQ
jgi:hypothetical protein